MTSPKLDHFLPNLSTFKPKHLELMAYAEHPKVEYLMAAGGIRSGKSVTIAAIIILRAFAAAGSRHGIFHAYGNICDRNLFELTFPQTFEILMPGYWAELVAKKMVNSTDRVIRLPNGSKILFFGLDDPNKIRGQEFDSIWLNEGNVDIDYSDIEILDGRLSGTSYHLDGTILKTKFFVDLNPKLKSSWEYQVFCEGLIPGDRTPIPQHKRYKWLQINPNENADNLPPGYLEKRFAGMTAAKKKGDQFGLWSEDNPNALFDPANIQRKSADIEEMAQIVVSLDPAGTSTNKSDSTGLIVAGRGHDEQYYVFEDATLKAKPNVWITFAEKLRQDYDGNWLISEKDYARDILEELIALTIPGAPVSYVESRGRGKRLRAEPIASLYAQKLVNHVPNPNKPMQFHALEQQMVEFDSPGYKGSPDRVDALVYALQFLSNAPVKPLEQIRLSGFL